MQKKRSGGIVYSTNPDFHFQSEDSGSPETLPPSRQQLRIWLEKNHRGGKQVTVIKGFVGSEDDLLELSRFLKTSCGTGGSVKDEEILVQGDFRDKVLQLLINKGYKAKKAGS